MNNTIGCHKPEDHNINSEVALYVIEDCFKICLSDFMPLLFAATVVLVATAVFSDYCFICICLIFYMSLFLLLMTVFCFTLR
jgi:hypothetical protein